MWTTGFLTYFDSASRVLCTQMQVILKAEVAAGPLPNTEQHIPLPCAPHTLSILPAPLPEYWKFNISKNVSVLTVFTLNPQVSFLNTFFSNWQYFIKDRGNPQTHLCRSFCDTDLVSCSQWLLQASGGIQIFKYLPIAQLLADLQCGSVSAALGCTNLVHQGNMETVVPPSLWQTSLVQVS